jgi:hypothetical protein
VETGFNHKAFVAKLKKDGLTHEQAMIALGLACEVAMTAYIQGYNNGYGYGHTDGKHGKYNMKVK